MASSARSDRPSGWRLKSHRQTSLDIDEQDSADPLSRILGFPSSDIRFLDEVLNKHALHCRDVRRERFQELLSLEVLDRVLGAYGLTSQQVRVVRSDRLVGPSEYERGALVDPRKVARLFAEGSTVIFDALHDRHEPLRRLCSAFSQQAGARTQANIYLTPPHSQGFRPHWDTHDVFVIQVEGSKRWRIYEGGEDMPVIGQKFDPASDEPRPIVSEFMLTAGDVLYLPRGVVHAAESGEETSLHITLGLIAYTWSEFLGQCLGDLTLRSSRWRENLPFGIGAAGAADFDEVRQELANRLAALPGELDLEAVLTARLDEVGAAFRPCASNYLQQAITETASLSPRSVVRHRPNVRSRTAIRDGQVVVIAAGRELNFPRTAARTVESVLQGESQVAGAIEDTLDWPGRKVVLETMIREGILEVVC